MAQLVFLNELSQDIGDVHPTIAAESLVRFVDVLLRIKTRLPKVALLSSEPIATMSIGSQFSIPLWLNESGASRDRARILLSFANIAPFNLANEKFGDPDPGVTQCSVAGVPAQGISYAFVYGGFPVSIDHLTSWHTPTIILEIDQILEQGEYTFQEPFPHASLLEHVETNVAWLDEIKFRDVRNSAELIARRDDLFPNLEFGPAVEKNLADLQVPAFFQVVRYLNELDGAIGTWNPKVTSAPVYPPHTTDESSSRKALCSFPVPGGKREIHSMHGRYTPGAGRIYFRLAHNPKRAVIGFIGTKV